MTPNPEQSRCDLAAEALLATGIITLKAFGTSMLPTLWPGDLTRIQSCSFDDLRPGDIVLCKTNSRFYLHRVTVKILDAAGNRLVTRGDSMPAPDALVPSADVLGKVIDIQHGDRDFVPVTKLGRKSQFIGRILGHSNLCMRFALKLHGPSPSMTDFSLSETAP